MTTTLQESQVTDILLSIFPNIKDDQTICNYLVSMLQDNLTNISLEFFNESISPFVEPYNLLGENVSIPPSDELCQKLQKELKTYGIEMKIEEEVELKLLDKIVVLSDITNRNFSATEQQTIDTLWGFQKIRKQRNELFEGTEAASAKYERKAAKEQRKFLEDLDLKIGGEENSEAQISTMRMPDLSSANREKDIHVHNFNITFGGALLLENANLKLVYGKRYGLIGKNGVGKSISLLRVIVFIISIITQFFHMT